MSIVKLISYTQNPLEVVYKAARICHAQEFELEEKVDELQMENLVKKLIKMGHESVLEHVSFTFYVGDISRVCSHQLVRHRIASYSQRSQRYTTQKADYVIPDFKTNGNTKPDLVSMYSNTISMIFEMYQLLLEQGIRKEEARYILPQSLCTELICTFNIRSLRNFLKLRLERSAQWEIREVAQKMFNIVNSIIPCAFYDLMCLYINSKNDGRLYGTRGGKKKNDNSSM